jgi:triose/dihydroxyacetone kinase / FAD-AMP lyase (cyclizing)
MTHFFNNRDAIVTEALDGVLLTAQPGTLARLDGYPNIKVVLRADWTRSRVAVISGGGAGHEPSHAGFVGDGMLTAAVSGEIFASPSVEAVLAAIRAVTGEPGCLLIVKNYTGDRLNFGLAAERARAEGYTVDMVIVADDIAIPGNPRPRGVAGTLFAHKLAGHFARAGMTLEALAAKVREAARDTVSIGASLSSCSIPGQAFSERLADGEGELGLGIHGEPGIERFAMSRAATLIETMIQRLEAAMAPDGRYALLINNLGAVPPVEMSLVARDVMQSRLASRIAAVVGPAPLMTALNMNGFSLSLLRLDDDREAALHAPVGPRSWPGATQPSPIVVKPLPPGPVEGIETAASAHAPAEALISRVCQELIAAEVELNRLDARVGDGDTGSTLATGARSILDNLGAMPLLDAGATSAAIGRALAASMGGSSGVLMSIFFTAAAAALEAGSNLPAALLKGLDRVRFYGGAEPGDRTMIDALAPALAALEKNGLEAAVLAAREGAEATRSMTKAKAGRSSYLAEHDLDGTVDPGAMAVAVVFEAIGRARTADAARS